MKMKTLAMLAASGLLAVSLAHIAPAFAEDGFDDGMGGQQLAMADTGASQIPSDAINGNENVQPGRMDTASNTSANSNTNNVTSATGPAPTGGQNPAPTANNDQPVPDVASGDEDY